MLEIAVDGAVGLLGGVYGASIAPLALADLSLFTKSSLSRRRRLSEQQKITRLKKGSDNINRYKLTALLQFVQNRHVSWRWVGVICAAFQGTA